MLIEAVKKAKAVTILYLRRAAVMLSTLAEKT